MKKLIPVTLFSLFFAAMSHNCSEYDYVNGKYIRKERFFYFCVYVTLILFAGLRTGYNDTVTYLITYANLDKFIADDTTLFGGIEWLKFGDNPGFVFFLRLLRRWEVSGQTFLMIFAIFTVGVNLWFIRKYSCNILMSILLYVTFAGYIFTLAAIKQCTAMAFCLLATDRAINKKYLQFVIFVFLGCLFHAYAFMYLIVPLLFFRPWSQYTVLMLVIFGLLGVSMQTLLGGLLNVTDMLGEGYDASSFQGEGVHPLRLLVTAVPAFLSLITAEQIKANEERAQYVIVNLTMLNAEIMFVALFGTANYFARLANYFIPFQAVSIPWLLKHYDERGKGTMSILAACGYLLFFVYSQAIHESFDFCYSSITLWEYLQSLR